eukprot:Selendium_serpulae@DN3218_c0_g1_i1.p1
MITSRILGRGARQMGLSTGGLQFQKRAISSVSLSRPNFARYLEDYHDSRTVAVSMRDPRVLYAVYFMGLAPMVTMAVSFFHMAYYQMGDWKLARPRAELCEDSW